MFQWVESHAVVVGILFAVSVLMFVGSLIAVPWLMVRIPADFFIRRQHYADLWRPRHPVLRIVLPVAKNAIGIVLVLAGLAMLVLPGQGVLTILVGLILLDFPGKFALERRLIQLPPVIKVINWLRTKAQRPPLQPPG